MLWLAETFLDVKLADLHNLRKAKKPFLKFSQRPIAEAGGKLS